MTPALDQTKRLNLLLPEQLYNEIQSLAEDQGTTITELLRRFIKLGLLTIKLQDHPEDGILIRQGGKEHKIFLM